jgi:hypothetical protein
MTSFAFAPLTPAAFLRRDRGRATARLRHTPVRDVTLAGRQQRFRAGRRCTVPRPVASARVGREGEGLAQQLVELAQPLG